MFYAPKIQRKNRFATSKISHPSPSLRPQSTRFALPGRFGNPNGGLSLSAGPDAVMEVLKQNMLASVAGNERGVQLAEMLFRLKGQEMRQMIVDRAVAVYSADFLADFEAMLPQFVAQELR